MVRPGAPNAALTGAWSTVVREPLAGRNCTIPVPLDAKMPIASYQSVVQAMETLLNDVESEVLCHDLSQPTFPAHHSPPRCSPPYVTTRPSHPIPTLQDLGPDRTLMLPSISASPRDLIVASAAAAEANGIQMGRRVVPLGIAPGDHFSSAILLPPRVVLCRAVPTRRAAPSR